MFCSPQLIPGVGNDELGLDDARSYHALLCLVVLVVWSSGSARSKEDEQEAGREKEERGKRPDVNVNVNVMTKMSTSVQVGHKGQRGEEVRGGGGCRSGGRFQFQPIKKRKWQISEVERRRHGGTRVMVEGGCGTHPWGTTVMGH